MDLISLFVFVIVVAFVIYLINTFVTDPMMHKVLMALLVLIVILQVIGMLGYSGSAYPVFRLHR